jgi:hypothetical protein
MEIIHRVSFHSSERAVEAKTALLGIRYEKVPLPMPGSYLGYFDIEESVPEWEAVAELIRLHSLPDFPHTTFTVQEKLSSEWVRIMANHSTGYPQPEKMWTSEVYADGGCPKCGIWSQRKSSFRIIAEPRLRKRDFEGLYWVWVIFASQKVFDAFGEAGFAGYEGWPIAVGRSGDKLSSLSELVVTEHTRPGMDASALRPEVCPTCHRVKYNAVTRGRIRYRRDAFPSDTDFVRSHEWFGSGLMAFNEFFASQRVARLVIDSGWKGLEIQPVELI